MKPTIKLATTTTPDGGKMELFQHDHDFSIMINGLELMNSRQHESEQELARLGCAHLSDRKAPCVLIGGLGMGYTLRQALEILNPDARVVVSELIPAIVDWNREYLRELNGPSLDDERTSIITGDIFQLILHSIDTFDAILLDVDNGPRPLTDSGNERLYSRSGIEAFRYALREQGILAIWSTRPSKAFEKILMSCRFHVRRYKVKAYKASSSKSLFIWVAAEDASILPRGGIDPGLPGKKQPGKAK